MDVALFMYICTMKRILSILPLFLLPLSLAFSQPTATLFRGRQPAMMQYAYNGTPFWESKSFAEGSIWYNGKVYSGVLLNIDAFHQEVQVKYAVNLAPIVIYRDEVAWLRLGDKCFVNLRYLGYDAAQEGFYEIVRDGPEALLRRVEKKFRSSTHNENGDGIGYTDPDYDPRLTTYFACYEYRYLLREGRLIPISRGKLRKLLRQGGEESGQGLLSDVRWHPVTEPSGTLMAQVIPSPDAPLPDGFFEAVKTEDDSISGLLPAQAASYRNKVYTIGVDNGRDEKVLVRGYVIDREADAPMPGVLVHDEKTETYAKTDAKGNYSILLPKGENIIHFLVETKEETVVKVDVAGEGNLDISMTDVINQLASAVISAQSMEQHRRTSMGLEKVSVKLIGKIPTAFGEGDVLKAIHTLPGVQTSGEAAGGINVRGGSPGENLILFNGNTIYNPSHLFGIFSAFNPDIVEEVQLYKATVPSQFGGRISSVMDVESRSGDMQKFRGTLGLGLLTSRFHVEGPLVRGKTSILAGARTTYSDWLLRQLPSSSYYSGARAGFTDANLVLTHRFSEGKDLRFSAYYAADRFTLTDNLSVRYGNWNASALYRSRDDKGSGFEFSAAYDHYHNTNGDYSWPQGAYDLTAQIDQFSVKPIWQRPLGEKHTLSFGGETVLYRLIPGVLEPYGEISTLLPDRLENEWGLEEALFVSDSYQLLSSLSLEAGARISSFQALKPFDLTGGPELRLSAKYTPVNTFSLKGGLNMMRQNVHLISNSSGISPTDTWRLSSRDIRPATGWQGAGGIYWTWVAPGLDFSAETYWKETSNALDYKAGANLSMNPHLADDLVKVYGRAYGVELMVKKPAGRLTGWLSYTWSRSLLKEMEDRGMQTIAGGDWYSAPYDRPHEVKLITNFAFTHRYSFSLNAEYSTGRPVTVPIGKYYFSGAWRMVYGERNTHRIPDYFRVDLAMNIDPGHYLRAVTHTSITIGVYNLLGRKNPYSVYFQPTRDGRIQGYLLSVFATQVPYINLNILF